MAMKTRTIKIMVVDDHQLIINGLKSLVEEEKDIVFSGGANDWEEAQDILQNEKIDVALIDINMPGMSGIDVTRKIKRMYPEVQVLALSMHDDFAMVQKMISAGASGYIIKRTTLGVVADAIRIVFEKGKFLSKEIQDILLEGIKVSEDPSGEMNVELSKREHEVLTLLGRELSNEEIAERLFISERTVESHRRNIFIKTKSKSVVGLIKFAIKNNLIVNENDATKIICTLFMVVLPFSQLLFHGFGN